jgi:hypothetical protein
MALVRRTLPGRTHGHSYAIHSGSLGNIYLVCIQIGESSFPHQHFIFTHGHSIDPFKDFF